MFYCEGLKRYKYLGIVNICYSQERIIKANILVISQFAHSIELAYFYNIPNIKNKRFEGKNLQNFSLIL